MKILIVGLVVLLCWSALSTHIYVCKIKGLCNESIAEQIDMVSHKDITPVDTLSKPLAPSQEIIPDNLIIHFAFDKSEFITNEETNKYADESNVYMNQNSQARLSITGHTDAIGSDEYNQTLGYRRAQAVQHYFESRGMPSNKIIVESKGEKEPVEDNNTKTGRASNRRAEITIKK